MKRLLVTFTLVILSIFTSIAQVFVSTTPENKNVILEEFTGIYCGYCPDGHLIAQNYQNLHPDDVVLIKIHSGGYAVPQGSDPDYQTIFGAAIESQADVAYYPSGTVNRHLFPGNTETAIGRSEWANAGDVILSESSPVNTWGSAEIDLGTNTLTVDVQLYYTGSQTISTNSLHEAVLQNNVEGPQSGMSGNPSSVLPNGNYNHQHMLRHLMTGQWGETISNIAQGTTYTSEFTWNIPSDINGVAVDPTNLEIAVFVSEGNQEILSGSMAGRNIIFPNTDDANISTSQATNLTCNASTTDLTVTFQNYGSAPLTSLDIQYSINGGASNTYPWSGNLASAAFETVTIPNVSLTANATNTVDFTLVDPNGVADPNTSNNTQSATFNGVGAASAGNATINITTDAYGSETTWTLTNASGSVAASGGPYNDLSSAGTTPQTPVSVTLSPNDCYTLTVLDSYGDGMNSGYGAGGYTVVDASGTVVASGGTFASEEQAPFQTGAATASNNINVNLLAIYPNPAKDNISIEGEYISIDIVDMFGKLILSNEYSKNINTSGIANGVYMINIKTKEGVQTQKITISK